jgi:AcrR family transcriptional regulator
MRLVTAGTTEAHESVSRDREATEQRILVAATRLFAEQGYRTVTVRAIASEAAVNPALISRYYGSKLGLFDAVLDTGSIAPRLADVPVADLPRVLAEWAMRSRLTDQGRGLAAAVRSVGSPEIAELLRTRLEKLLVDPIAGRLTGPDARTRAALCIAVLSGVGTVRRVLAHDVPATDDTVTRLAEVFRSCLNQQC